MSSGIRQRLQISSPVVRDGSPCWGELVLFRVPDGTIAALSNLCVHRGGALSDGRVVGDSVECPFHGWRYRGNGHCVLIPNRGDQPVPARARVDAFPVRQRFGIVWVYLGDKSGAERPPLPPCPEFGDEHWRSNRTYTTWDAHYSRVVESDLDHTHVAFVHRRSIGAAVDPRSPDPEVRVDAHRWGATATVRQYMAGIVRAEFVSHLSWHLPTFTRNEFVTPWGTTLFYNFHLPVDASTTQTYVLRFRNLLRPRPYDPLFDLLDWRVRTEDKRAVRAQRPEEVPANLAAELNLKADALTIAYRKALSSHGLPRGSVGD